jgi:hypothetical protein
MVGTSLGNEANLVAVYWANALIADARDSNAVYCHLQC